MSRHIFLYKGLRLVILIKETADKIGHVEIRHQTQGWKRTKRFFQIIGTLFTHVPFFFMSIHNFCVMDSGRIFLHNSQYILSPHHKIDCVGLQVFWPPGSI